MSAPRTAAKAAPPKQRRALSNVGGRVRTHGDPRLSALFAHALERTAIEAPDVGTHGFHAWPARMHWALPATILGELGVAGKRVLDPFAGGGTVLVEAMRAGARGSGIDLNPLSSLVVEVKCSLRTPAEGRRFLESVADVAEASLDRVQTRTPAKAPLSREQAMLYGGHILKELAGLLEEIDQCEDVRDQRAMRAVFSSLLVKLSKKKADTSEEVVDKRLRKGLSTELFVRKSGELVQRWAELRTHAPKDAEEPRLFVGDARRAPELLGKAYRADLVMTSPPYGGTYDYVAHHALRLAWLGLPDRDFSRSELGARRSLRGEEAQQRFDREVLEMLSALRRVMKDDALAILVLGDAELGRLRISPIDQLDALAPRPGLRLIAGASE